PGNSLPSKNSSDAPPPVETCVKSSSKPSCSAAVAESPPPMIVIASSSFASDSHTLIVPCAKLDISKTPIGPFHTTVFASLSTSSKTSTVFGPISNAISSASISEAPLTAYSVSLLNSLAATTSTGKTSLSLPVSSNDFARSSLSSSTSDFPVS